MAVAAQQRQSRHAEALQLHLMADTVSRFGAENPVLLCHALNILVIIRVFKSRLQGVVIDIGNALHCPHTADAHRLELQVGHRAGGVLCQGLVDPDRYLFAGLRNPADQVCVQNLLCKVHVLPPKKMAVS